MQERRDRAKKLIVMYLDQAAVDVKFGEGLRTGLEPEV